MHANSCGESAMRGISTDAKESDSAQAIAMAGLAAPPRVEFSSLEQRYARLDRRKSSEDSQLRESDSAKARAKSDKQRAENGLRGTPSVAQCENALEKSEIAVRTSTLTRWLKFNAVGGIGIAVQFAGLFLLKTIFHFNYLAATAIAVEAAVVHNFVWHEQFTWADRVSSSWRASLPRFARFNFTTGAVSILGNLALMKVMVGFGGVNYLVANLIAIALCSVANFLVSEQWVFEE